MQVILNLAGGFKLVWPLLNAFCARLEGPCDGFGQKWGQICLQTGVKFSCMNGDTVHLPKRLPGHGTQVVDFIDLWKKQGENQAKCFGVKNYRKCRLA